MKNKSKKLTFIALISLSLLASCASQATAFHFDAPIRYADGDDADSASSTVEDPTSSSSSSEAPVSSSESGETSASSSEETSSSVTSSSEDSSSPSSSDSSSSISLPSISLPDISISIPVSSNDSSSQDSSSSSSDEEKKEDLMIGTVDDWNEFAKECNRDASYSINKNVYLRNDIDFQGKAFTPIATFQGTFDGSRHALKNIRVTGEKDYPSLFHIVTKNGIVKNLDVLDVDIDCQDEDFVGVISKNYGTVYGLKVTGSILGQNQVGVVASNGVRNKDDDKNTIKDINALINDVDNQATVAGLSNVGGVCGTNFGTIRNSLNEGNVNATAKNANSTAIDIGGIAGYSLGKLDGNENRGEITMDIDSLQVGGIVGKANGELYFERNYGTVTGTKYVGGVAGYYGNMQKNTADLQEYFNQSTWEDFVKENKDWLKNLGFDVDDNNFNIDEDDFEEKITTIAFDYSYSDGDIHADSDAGGIVGLSTSTGITIKEAVSKSDVTLRVGTYGGGIAGDMRGGAIESSIASGHIKGTNFVGGIAGHSLNLKDNLSSALVEGSEAVGGIVGSLGGDMTSNLSNALVVNSDNKASAGSLAGVVENYDEAADSFLATVEYNYYVSELGGINRRQYGGDHFKDAAKQLTIDEMTRDDQTLSSSFGSGFDSDAFVAGKDKDYFPTPKYLSEVEVDKNYGSEDDFKNQYNNYAAIYKAAALYDSKVTCLVTFNEWREEDGNLYDDYGNVDKSNYEITSYAKVSIHDTLKEVPDFKYAEKQDDEYIYTGKKNTYIVAWDLPTEEIDHSISVYATYDEQVKTLTYNSNEYVVEGSFAKGTRIDVIASSSVNGLTLYTVKFYDKDNNEFSVRNVNLKIKLSMHPDKNLYYVDGALTTPIEGTKDTSGYFVFRYSTGQYFTYMDEKDITEELPSWVIPTVASICAALVAVLILAIGLSVGKKKGIKEEQVANGTYVYHKLVDNTHAKKENEDVVKENPQDEKKEDSTAAKEEKQEDKTDDKKDEKK